jgi:predicted dienelactone hydrolase
MPVRSFGPFVADRLADLDADDPLTGRLDLSRLTAIGHSFGGAAALQ